jgi:ATP-binding cassette subfamily B protein
MLDLLKDLWSCFGPSRKRQFFLIILLMFAASLFEIVSIGAVIPFLGALASPEKVFDTPQLQFLFKFFDLTSPDQMLLPMTAIFCCAAIMSGLMRLLLLWAINRISFSIGSDLSIQVYRHLLYQSYSFHLKHSSSTAISSISSKVDAVIYQVLVQVLVMISSSLILCLIFLTLILIDPLITLLIFFGFSCVYGSIIFFTKNKIKRNSISIAEESTEAIKCLQEGLGGIRDIILDNSQEVYCEIYKKADLSLRHSQSSNQFIGGSPKFIIEAIGLTLIAILAYFLSLGAGGVLGGVPILGAIALGAQRLLPVLQQLFNSWAIVNGAKSSLRVVMDLLGLTMPLLEIKTDQMEVLKYEQVIELKDLGFKYDQSGPDVIRNINLKIYKGSRIGIVGPTGSGKSTLLDLLMGIQEPTVGEISVDGVKIAANNVNSWRAQIAHVPQAIFLADRTILENIAFGVPKSEIDYDRVIEAAKKAQISDAIEGWKNRYETYVGERGIRLSGGQKQRIGLARALYKNANLIILDEATSALDYETEDLIMQTIDSLSEELTVVIVAHRLNTLKNCDQIILVDNYGIKLADSYEDL